MSSPALKVVVVGVAGEVDADGGVPNAVVAVPFGLGMPMVPSVQPDHGHG